MSQRIIEALSASKHNRMLCIYASKIGYVRHLRYNSKVTALLRLYCISIQIILVIAAADKVLALFMI